MDWDIQKILTFSPDARFLRTISEKVFCNQTLLTDYEQDLACDFNGLGIYKRVEYLDPTLAILQSLLSMEQRAYALRSLPGSVAYLSSRHYSELHREAASLLRTWNETCHEYIANAAAEHITNIFNGAEPIVKNWRLNVDLHSLPAETCVQDMLADSKAPLDPK